MPARSMAHEADPRDITWEEVGDLSGIELTGTQILCAIYKRPEKTKSGIFLTDSNRAEDVYQGKVGMVVKLGPLAFDDTGDGRFGALGKEAGAGHVELGDWLFYKASDGFSVSVNGRECRILNDEDVRGRIQAPDQIW